MNLCQLNITLASILYSFHWTSVATAGKAMSLFLFA